MLQDDDSIVVQFAGDSGDGVQVTGGQFSLAAALSGADLITFPDFPAEIRAPAGTLIGVSAFQIHFGGRKIYTVGDYVDALVALNPAALKAKLPQVKPGGLLILDQGSWTPKSLRKAQFENNPLEDGSLKGYQLMTPDIHAHTLRAVAPFHLTNKEALRTRNMWALGLVLWLYGQENASVLDWIDTKFAHLPDVREANKSALKAGHAFGETSEMVAYRVGTAPLLKEEHRIITGAEALALGLVAGTLSAKKTMVFCSYPITPASPLLHFMAALSTFPVITFQAEDEISAACAAIGASYGGQMGVTASSGPGLALKGEALGLAVASELPLVVVNAQRGGPSTGLPTKTEQSDLLQAVWGRHGDAPMCVLAADSVSSCFSLAQTAIFLAITYMTPVIVLTDGYLQNTSQPWVIPKEPFLHTIKSPPLPSPFLPYGRDPITLARPWAPPGTPGGIHRIGGLERHDQTGHVSYDPSNHQKMTLLRQDKIAGMVQDIPPQTLGYGEPGDTLCLVGWGSTFGPLRRAATLLRQEGYGVAHLSLQHLFPLPSNLGDLLRSFQCLLVAEMNMGQLATLLQATYALHTLRTLTHVTGQPLKVHVVKDAALTLLKETACEPLS